MQAQVKEWGNSQGIRLSKEVLKSAGIFLHLTDNCLSLVPNLHYLNKK